MAKLELLSDINVEVDYYNYIIAKNIKNIREDKNISLNNLSQLSNIDMQDLADYENSSTPIPATLLYPISKALDAPLSELVSGVNDKI